jgi:hypothetical protein
MGDLCAPREGRLEITGPVPLTAKEPATLERGHKLLRISLSSPEYGFATGPQIIHPAHVNRKRNLAVSPAVPFNHEFKMNVSYIFEAE